MDEYSEANRALWDEWTGIHLGSAFYDVERFKEGGVRLRAYELEEIGEVAGKDVLHLQCHFGLDTLTWARLGARVTGVDFAERVIAHAPGAGRRDRPGGQLRPGRRARPACPPGRPLRPGLHHLRGDRLAARAARWAGA
jgi:hypothetical protein